jgi:hypothetical protein
MSSASRLSQTEWWAIYKKVYCPLRWWECFNKNKKCLGCPIAQVFMGRVMPRVGLGIRNCTNPCWLSKLIIMVIKKIQIPSVYTYP